MNTKTPPKMTDPRGAKRRAPLILALAIIVAFITLMSTLAIQAEASQKSGQATTKEETVHVQLEPNGDPVSVTSRVVLENADSLETIVDQSSLDQIEVAEEATIIEQEGNRFTIEAHGQDVSYSGTTTQKLPVEVSIEYRLDGQVISPEAIAGKSGTVSLAYRFTNTTDTPFAAVGILELDDDRLSNIAIENGKIMAGTDTSTAIGICFPGVQDQIDIEGIDIPSSFTITAEAHDFQLDSASILVSSTIFEDLDEIDFDTGDSSHLNKAFDGLYAALDQLIAGTKSASSGATELQLSLNELAQSAALIAQGVSYVADGAANDIEAVATKQTTAIKELRSALFDTRTTEVELSPEKHAALEQQLSDLEASTKQLETVATTLRAQDAAQSAKQLSALAQGNSAAAEAAGQLSNGLGQLERGLVALKSEGIAPLNESLSEVVSQLDAAGQRVKDLAANARAYRSFTDTTNKSEGSVLFIYQVDGIGASHER